MEMNGLVAAHLREENRELWDRDDIWVMDFSPIMSLACKIHAALHRDADIRMPVSVRPLPAE